MLQTNLTTTSIELNDKQINKGTAWKVYLKNEVSDDIFADAAEYIWKHRAIRPRLNALYLNIVIIVIILINKGD